MSQETAILIVEDEERIRKLIRMFLEREGYRVEEAEHGGEALEKLAQGTFNLVILDLMMPEMDGWTACRKIRESNDLPIIMLTARGEEWDRVLGFELGADDYVVKPFSTRELVMRVKALLRRASNGQIVKETNEEVFAFPELVIKPESHKVLVANEDISLTPLEYDLLLFLAKHPSRVFTREQLLERVWGYDYFGELRTVDTHVKRLREKLAKAAPSVADYVATVWGVGYKFEVGK
ncbi:MAG: response regulator transcription factor [Thermincolia bacterium]